MKKKFITWLFTFATHRFLMMRGWKLRPQVVMAPSGPKIRAAWEKQINVKVMLLTGSPGTTTVTVGTGEAIRRELGEGQFVS